jgi:integrase
VNLEIATLRAVLGPRLWANLKEEKVRMLPENDDAGRALDAGEEKRLLQQCAASRSRTLYPAVVLALDTGLRYAELTNLRWRQVDLTALRLVVGKSKTEAGRGRIVPLTPRAAATLSLWASRFQGRAPEHFVFPSERYGQARKGERHLEDVVYGTDPTRPIGRLKEAWEAAKRRTDDEEKGLPAVVCRWHDLRHSWVTRLLEHGQSLAVVAQLAGWSASTAARMAKRYGHISEGVLRDAIAVLGQPENPKASPEFHPESGNVVELLPS